MSAQLFQETSYLHPSGNGTQSLNIYERWVLDVPLEFRLRVLGYSTEAEIMKSELLPGGRWLLTCSTQNQYFVHDLHVSSSQPQELANPGQFDSESGTLDELTSLKIVDNSKENFCFRFVVWNRGGSLKCESDWIGKFCNNSFFPEGDVTRMFVYATNIFEDEGESSFDTKTNSTRCSLRSRGSLRKISLLGQFLYGSG